jgi:hypothetical protein
MSHELLYVLSLLYFLSCFLFSISSFLISIIFRQFNHSTIYLFNKLFALRHILASLARRSPESFEVTQGHEPVEWLVEVA